MVQGLGTDIIEVNRIAEVIERHGLKFLNRIFTAEEQTYCNQHREANRHFAGRWAAKEAVAKALGTGIDDGISWQDIEIQRESSGKPFVKLSEKANRKFDHPMILISISHCHNYASATAIVLS